MDVSLELITACRKKERKAQFELYRLTYSYLMAICRRYSNNSSDADVLLNQGFLKILNNLNKYQTKIPFGLWIRRVMINVTIDEFRKRKRDLRMVDYVDNYDLTHETPITNDVIMQMNLDSIYYSLDQLPPSSRNVFNLFVIDGYSHKEIAILLNISEGTSKWHVNFARVKLKEIIMASNNSTIYKKAI
ncbi:MAG: RNA polymerase sigma factor [Bacteroidia bacterium]